MTNHDDYTAEEKVMKHVVVLSLMTLQIAALHLKCDADFDVDAVTEAITTCESMIACDLGLSPKDVIKLYKIVMKDFEEFTDMPEAIRDMLCNIKAQA